MASPKDKIVVAGAAKVVAELPFSDGNTALEIKGFWMSEDGVLDSTFRVMPFIPDEWRGSDPPEPFERGARGFVYGTMEGAPELLFVTERDPSLAEGVVYRYAPWSRTGGGDHPGLGQQYAYTGWTPEPLLGPVLWNQPPTFTVAGPRVYFTLGDGTGAYVWDGTRVRAAGFSTLPAPPYAEGPDRNGTSANAGGFSVRGRVGQSEGSWYNGDGEITGGMDEFLRRYAVVLEGPDGAYSPTSPVGGSVFLNLEMADPARTGVIDTAYEWPLWPDMLLRRFRTMFDEGSQDVAAVILLATPNIKRLAPNDTGAFRFHGRYTGAVNEIIDDVPDGELGSVWEDRAQFPSDCFFVVNFGGSNWYFRTNSHPARGWWTEQTEVGPVYESILGSHWFDIYPATGEITCAYPVRLNGQDAAGIPAMLIGKPGALHYVAGDYPFWKRGTLHPKAGIAGWYVIQSLPNGATLWAGNGTFWMLDEDGSIEDVGKPIRKRLARVNWMTAHLGSSWVDREHGEAVFVLALDDHYWPHYEFIWDYRLGGWRFRESFEEVYAAQALDDLVMVSGKFNGIKNVWLYGRGYPLYVVTPPTWEYTTGWVRLSSPDKPPSQDTVTTRAVALLEERGLGSAGISGYKNWNLDSAECTQTLYTYIPDGETYAYLAPATSSPAIYDESKWRSRRHYMHELIFEVDAAKLLSVKITGTAPIGLASLDIHGPVLSPAGERGARPADWS